MDKEKGLIARYLQAVRFWLPKEQQDDIVAELAEELQSKIEERESALGRKLDEAEIAALLKQSGRPMVVASRFRPQESLIGPVLFPIYVFVLKIVALCYLLPWLLVLIGIAVWKGSAGMPGYFFSGLGTFWTLIFTSSGVVTIVFTVLERVPREKFLDDWDPRKLPTVRVSDRGQIKRSSSIAEVIANLLVVFWWLNLSWFNSLVFPVGVHVVLSPIRHYFYWGFLSVALLSIALSVTNLLQPYWTRTRSYMKLGLDIAGSGLFCWVVKARMLAEVIWPNVSAAKTAEVVAAINTNAARSFPFAVAACVLIVVLADLPRLISSRPSGSQKLNGVHVAS